MNICSLEQHFSTTDACRHTGSIKGVMGETCRHEVRMGAHSQKKIEKHWFRGYRAYEIKDSKVLGSEMKKKKRFQGDKEWEHKSLFLKKNHGL